MEDQLLNQRSRLLDTFIALRGRFRRLDTNVYIPPYPNQVLLDLINLQFELAQRINAMTIGGNFNLVELQRLLGQLVMVDAAIKEARDGFIAEVIQVLQGAQANAEEAVTRSRIEGLFVGPLMSSRQLQVSSTAAADYITYLVNDLHWDGQLAPSGLGQMQQDLINTHLPQFGNNNVNNLFNINLNNNNEVNGNNDEGNDSN